MRFPNSRRTYPASCHRRDLRKGDLVVISTPDQVKQLKVAKFDHSSTGHALTRSCEGVRNSGLARKGSSRRGVHLQFINGHLLVKYVGGLRAFRIAAIGWIDDFSQYERLHRRAHEYAG